MQLSGSIVTFDALHTQTKTIRIIHEGCGKYVGALKGNQVDLEFDDSACFTAESMKKIRENRKDFTNLSILNKMALSLCKLAQPLMKNRSIRSIRKEFSWSFEENLAMLLNAFDEGVLKNALENAKNPEK